MYNVVLNEVMKERIISKDDYKKYFNERRIINKEEYINYLKHKFDKINTFLTP